MGINPAKMNAFSFKMKLATAFVAITLVMQLLGSVTSSWIRVSKDGIDADFGLWKGCVHLTDRPEWICISYSDMDSNDTESCIDEEDPLDQSVPDTPTCLTVQILRKPPWDPTWFEVIRVLEMIGLGGAILVMFLCLLCLIYGDVREECTSVIIIVVCFFTATLTISGGILLIRTTDSLPVTTEAEPSWSLDVSIFSSVVAALAGTIVIIDLKEEACLNLYHYDFT